MADLFTGKMSEQEAIARLNTLDGDFVSAVWVIVTSLKAHQRIADVARLMRKAQREYFRDRTATALETAKNQERQLDSLLRLIDQEAP